MTEISELLDFSQDFFSKFAMQFFSQSGHTFHTEAIATNNSIKSFIYSVYKPKQVLLPTDWEYLDQVKEISWLFSNGKRYFGNSKIRRGIDYFAIDLFTQDKDRSQIAFEIHRIIARLTLTPFSVVLFRANQNYMLSWAYRIGEVIKVILSDWFSIKDILNTNIFERIDASQYSNSSAFYFLLDFIYNFARDYYIRPESREYIEYGLFPEDYSEQFGSDITRAIVKQVAEENYSTSKDNYQFDYVDEEYQNQKEQWLSIDDVNMLLLELDLEIKGFTNLNADKPYNGFNEDENFEGSIEDDYGYIDAEIFNDPIKMLKWLEYNFYDGKEKIGQG